MKKKYMLVYPLVAIFAFYLLVSSKWTKSPEYINSKAEDTSENDKKPIGSMEMNLKRRIKVNSNNLETSNDYIPGLVNSKDRLTLPQNQIDYEDNYVVFVKKPSESFVKTRYPHKQGLKSRKALPKENVYIPVEPDQNKFIIKFKDDLLARVLPDSRLSLVQNKDEEILSFIKQNNMSFSPMNEKEDSLYKLEDRAAEISGTAAADLNGILFAHVDGNAVDLAKELNKLDSIEYAEVLTTAIPQEPSDIAPVSEDLTSYQDHREKDGIDVDYAWQFQGTKGEGIRVSDIETNINKNHEDLVDQNIYIEPGVTPLNSADSIDHGTAVMGVLAAGDNGYGMTGTTPNASFAFYFGYSSVSGYRQAKAIQNAASDSAYGDVVMLELQTYGPNDKLTVAEWSQSVWLATKTATDAGVIILAAAGNGSDNLDHTAYDGYHARGDSGAIIVGAGSYRSRDRVSFSTYGSRVNVQGWGDWSVKTLGYGDFRKYGNDDNREYTYNFGGTSSATPIATSVAVGLQSYMETHFGRRFSPSEMRELLVKTGKPQGSYSAWSKIGPLPDFRGGLDYINSTFTKPNDTNDYINLNDYTLKSYGGSGQDRTGAVSIKENGTKLDLNGNRWKAITIDYTITPNTVLEFDFSSNKEGEVHAIGFDNDLALDNNSPTNAFKVYGTQDWGIQDYYNYSGTGTKRYIIPVGEFFTGNFQHLVFANDDDNAQIANSVYSNIQIYESEDSEEPVILPIPYLSYNASSDNNENDLWENKQGISGFDLSLISPAQRVSVYGSSYNKITHAYKFDGNKSMAAMQSLDRISPNPSTGSATFEFWVRPESLTGDQVLFESGGHIDGVSLKVSSNEISFIVKDGSVKARATSTNPLNSSEFSHVIGVYDSDVNGNGIPDIYLYVNGVLSGKQVDVSNLKDWAGSNKSGLAGINENVNDSYTHGFNGEIFSFNFYLKALTQVEISDLFQNMNNK